MSDINVRADAVDVEQIMRQIRARIREKRGADYTEEELTQLATVKIEKFIDPTGLRSDLVDEFRKSRPRPLEPPDPIRNPPPMIKPVSIPGPAALPVPVRLPDAPLNFAFSEETIFETHRGPLRFVRRLLRPLLKLFFNPNPIGAALHIQARANTQQAETNERLQQASIQLHEYAGKVNDQLARVAEHQEYFNHVQIQWNQQMQDRLQAMEDRAKERVDREGLYYELMHNITLEVTRMGIEVHNMAMRLESLSSRLEFDERRSRALEGVVQYRPFTPQRIQNAPAAVTATPGDSPSGPAPSGVSGQGEGTGAASGERRRRRRRRRRRPGQTLAEHQGPTMNGGPAAGTESADADDARAEFDAVDDGLDSSDVPDDSDGSAS